MYWRPSILVWFIALGLVSVGAAQDDGVPHLELVRGLREHGYHDLALEYLEKIQAQPDKLSAEIKSALPLELARSRSDVAAQIPPGLERDQLLQKSRSELEGFLKSNPPGQQGQEAELALANTVAEQARSLSSAAGRAGILDEKKPPAAVELQKNALARFDEADRIFGSLQKKLEDQQSIRVEAPNRPNLKAPPPPKVPPIYLATLYYRAQARYDKSRMAGLGVRESGIANDEARQLAEKLSVFRNASPVGWQGYALYARTLEGGDDKTASGIYRQIDLSASTLAGPAQRMVRYFPLARADATGEIAESGSNRTQFRTQAERWLQLYGALAGTARDAQHVRYILIRIYAKELEETPERTRGNAENQAKLERALALIDGLDNGRAENQEALERLKYGMLRLAGRSSGNIDSLRTFDECLLRASMEFYNVQAAEGRVDPNTAPLTDKTLAAHIEAALAAARRAQSFLRDTVSERNRIRLLNIMQGCLRRMNDAPRAAILCEYMANSAKQAEVAQSAAGEALRLYQFLARQNGKDDPIAREHMMAMATFLDQRFPQSPQAAEAQALLGKDLIAKKQYDPAIALLIKIDKSQPAYASARYYAGVAAWTKHREANKDKIKTRSADSTRALALLGDAAKAFGEMKNKDVEDQRMEFQALLLIVGIHDTFGDADKVLEASAPLLGRIEKKEMPAGLAPGIEMQILETAMSAYIQKRDLQQGAAKILGVIAKRKDDPQLGNVTTFLQRTALRIRQQLDELQKQGPTAQSQYQATLESFRQFLKQMEADPKLPSSQRLWLGTSYAAIGDLAKAAQLLQAISPPPAGSSEQDVALYRQAVSLRMATLRQLAQNEADPNDRDKALAKLEKELQGVMKEDWARKNPILVREEILILQNRGMYSGRSGAIARWDQFRSVLRPAMEKNKAAKDLFAEATYNLAYCVYQEAELLKDSKAKAKGIDRAAAIVNEARRHHYGGQAYDTRYQELLASPKHKDLKDAVDRLTAETASSTTTPKIQ
jgi:hypothetical protein